MVAFCRLTARDLEIDQGISQPALSQQLRSRFIRLGNIEVVAANLAQTPFQAAVVTFGRPETSVVAEQHFVDAVAKKKTAVQDGDFRLFGRSDYAIHIG